MTKTRAIKLLTIGLLLILVSFGTNAQKSKPVEKQEDPKPAVAKAPTEKQIIDSLQEMIAQKQLSADSINQLYDLEKKSTADLRDQLIQLDDYRKRLEVEWLCRPCHLLTHGRMQRVKIKGDPK